MSRFELPLANGKHWVVEPGEENCHWFVERYAAICNLSRIKSANPESLQLKVFSTNSQAKVESQFQDGIRMNRRHYFAFYFSEDFSSGALLINLEEITDQTTKANAISWIGVAMLLQLLLKGDCVPCHCACLNINGKGVIIGAPGNTGKTTCARRVPPPHRALTDDFVLLFDLGDRIVAQVMPTWSELINGDEQYKTDCSQQIGVSGIFFLLQRSNDQVEKISHVQTVVHLNTALQDLIPTRILTDYQGYNPQQLRAQVFEQSQRIAQKVPTWYLHATLDGDFWNPIAKVL